MWGFWQDPFRSEEDAHDHRISRQPLAALAEDGPLHSTCHEVWHRSSTRPVERDAQITTGAQKVEYNFETVGIRFG